MGAHFRLGDFSAIFQLRTPTGKHYVLVGGQAVNYWAERYVHAEPGLFKFQPFTSEDIDFYGNGEDVQHIASQLERAPVFPPKVAMTALAGAIPLRLGGNRTNIEVVRQIPGLAANAVASLAVEMEWHGQTIRVLDPISLLICKIDLALTVPQQKRQDVTHVKILQFCVRGFLREFLQEVEAARLPAKAWLGAVNRLLKHSKTTRGKKASKQFGFTWLDYLPQLEIAQSQTPKIISFRKNHLANIN